MVAFKIDPKKTALLVFDMINDFVKEGAPSDHPEIRRDLVPRLKKLIAHCRSKSIPVIYVCHATRRDGSDIGIIAEILPKVAAGKLLIKGTEGVQVYDELKPQEGDIVIEKRRYSAFRGTDFELILRSLGKDTLIITGTTTSTGIESTAREALDMDIKVIFPSDGTYSGDIPDMGWGPVSGEEIMRVVLTVLQYRFARVLTIDELTAELK